jgi:hypothetical protein
MGQAPAKWALPGKTVSREGPGTTSRETSLRELGHASNIQVKGIFPSRTFWFPKAEGATVIGAQSWLKVRVSHSSSLMADRSNLTVLVEDTPVRTRRLDVAREAWFEEKIDFKDVKVPAEQTFVKIELRFYNVLSDNPCKDLTNPALWALIDADTTLHLTVRETEAALGLSKLRMIYGDRANRGVTLVLPDNVGGDLVTPVTWLTGWVHRLVRDSGSDGELVILRGSEFAAGPGGHPYRHVVFLGDLSELVQYFLGHPELHKAYHNEFLKLFDQAAGLEDKDGYLLVTGEPDASRLFVTGKDAIGLRRAVAFLIDPAHELFPGRETAVHDFDYGEAPPVRVPPYAVRLRDLGYSDQQARGVATHSLGFNFMRADLGPNVKEVACAPIGDHSTFLDAKQSSMNILFNQVPIKGIRLDEKNAHIDGLTVDLPPDQMNPGTNSVEVLFDLRVDDENCTRIWFDQAWATLSVNSHFVVKRTEPIRSEELVFQTFPDPFLRKTAILLPEDPAAAELEAAAWVLAALADLGGRRAYPFTPVYTFADWRKAVAISENLIVIASTSERMGEEFRSKLKTPLQTKGSSIVLIGSNDQTIYSATTTDPLGLAQLFANPFSNGGGVLSFTATSKDRMLPMVARILADQAALKKVTGNVLILDRQRGLHSYAVGEEVRLAGGAVEVMWWVWLGRYKLLLVALIVVGLAFFLAFLYRKTRGIRLGTP